MMKMDDPARVLGSLRVPGQGLAMDPGPAVSFGYAMGTGVDAAARTDLSGTSYCPGRQLLIDDITGQPVCWTRTEGTQYTTKEDNQTWTDKD